MSSVNKKKRVYIGSKIPQNQKSTLDHAIYNGDYLNISGFVRDAVKEKLQREDYLSADQRNIQKIGDSNERR
jgi:Arc/MetJ-type ribon-helix-helix transcriptional regulator